MRKARKAFALVLCALASCALFAQIEQSGAYKLYNRGEFSAAIRECRDVLESNPKDMDNYAVLCWALLANGQYREAEYWSTEGLGINRYEHRLIEALAESKYFLNKNDDALALFQEYISLVSNTGSRRADAYYYMGEIYIRQGFFNHADIALTLAVRYAPLNDLWWVRLGFAREMSQNYREAYTAYDNALAINPEQHDAQRGKERVNTRL